MGEPTDPVEILRRLRPPRRRSGPLQPGDDPRMDALLEDVLRRLDHDARSEPRRARGPRPRRLIAAVLAIGLIGGASAAAAILLTRDDHRQVVSCWSDQEPTAIWEARIGQNDSPRAACAEPWRNGDFGTAGPPPLVECVAPSGIIAVVPGDDNACETVGLPKLDTEPGSADPDAAGELLYELLVVPLAERCADEAETVALTDEVLDAHELTDWAVDSNAPFTEQRACGRVSIDVGSRTIWITPVPRPPTP